MTGNGTRKPLDQHGYYAAATLVARMEDASLDQAVVWDDVGTFDGRPWRGAVDIVTAGYPCQPFSVAGKRRGADDPRHLWPHVARIIGEVEPPFVFLENVAHHLRLGFPEVAAGLVGMGYKLAAGLFTAAEVGAPHKRERLFILAAREGDELADPARLLRHPVEWRKPDGIAAALADAEGERQREPADEADALAGSGPAWDEPRDDGRALADAADRQLPQPGWRPARREGSGPHGAGLADADGERRLQAERWEPEDGRSDPCSRMWMTPTARDHKDGATSLANTPVNGLLGRQVLVTPMAGSDTSEPRRTLNPLFVEALMGWPTGWTGFASVETAWSRWLRRMRCELWQLNCWPMDEVA
jgi:DNA (cytosine-5)-methyltransferase 1